MKNIFAVILTCFISFSAFASTGTGKIVGLIPFVYGNEEILIIKVENTSPDTPDCNGTHRYAIKNSSVNFKTTQSVALAAFMAGTPVVIRGANNCDAWGNAETFTFLCLGAIPC